MPTKCPPRMQAIAAHCDRKSFACSMLNLHITSQAPWQLLAAPKAPSLPAVLRQLLQHALA
jgi:hypothetical protein